MPRVRSIVIGLHMGERPVEGLMRQAELVGDLFDSSGQCHSASIRANIDDKKMPSFRLRADRMLRRSSWVRSAMTWRASIAVKACAILGSRRSSASTAAFG